MNKINVVHALYYEINIALDFQHPIFL